MNIEIFNKRGDVTPIVIVADGNLDKPAPIGSTSINVIGRNILDYGDEVGQNFQWILENFADATPPAGEQRGQLWYDISNPTSPVLRAFGEISASWDAVTRLSDDNAPTIQSGIDLNVNNNRIINIATPVSAGDAANKLYVDTEITNSLSGLSNTFTGLTDTPTSYSGNANKVVSVKASIDGLEFKTLNFTNMGDTPAQLVGAANQLVRVNSTSTALEFVILNLNDFSTTNPINLSGNRLEGLGDPNSGDDALNRGFSDDRYLRDTISNANGFAVRTSSTGETIARTLTAGSGVSVSNGSGVSSNPIISHSDTSSQASVNNSGDTVIQDITLDTFGHITNITSKTIAAAPAGTPIGVVTSFAGSTAPSGWLLCNGDAVSQTTFAALFGVIGTTYGVGSAGTFRVPNLNGRVPVGNNNGGVATGTTTRALGDTGGDEDVVLIDNNLPSHRHRLFNSLNQGNNDDNLTFSSSTKDRSVTADRTRGGDTEYMMGTNNASPTSTPNAGWSGFTGASVAHENLPPFLVLNSIIKT